jgi:hypothetical protein
LYVTIQLSKEKKYDMVAQHLTGLVVGNDADSEVAKAEKT